MPVIPRIALIFAALLALALPASAKPPIEAFGDAPDIGAMQLSPDGTKVAYLQHNKDLLQLVLYDLQTNKSEALATVGAFKARGITFPTNDYVILHASMTTRNMEYLTNKFEHTSAFAVNLKTHKTAQLLTRADWLHPAQSGLGRILGMDPSGKYALMPAFVLDKQITADPLYNLLKVNLDTGAGARIIGGAGASTTDDWIVNGKGEIVARTDWNDKTNDYSIRVYSGDNSREIFKRSGPQQHLEVIGLSQDEKSLVVTDRQNSEFFSLYQMSLDNGALSAPLLKRNDADIERPIIDKGRVVVGVEYAGMFPSYSFFDRQLDAEVKAIQSKLPQSSVYLTSWDETWSKLLFLASGGGISDRYLLYDRKAHTLNLVAVARSQIKAADVGEVVTIEYKAQDGMKIPALVTWPAGVSEANRKNLPMIVMPHGGPEAYDSVHFDWLAQFFANEGYVVFQPNFRGSGGFGESFAAAGHGEWGRKMQSDITDGARALAKMGWADPNRMCIVGWSYGGYAALAGGALTPDQYKCVVAIAGVSNLKEMLGYEKRTRGAESTTFDYWRTFIGDPDRDGDRIDAVSPVRLAANFKVPVLLIHGADDLTVPSHQSDQMEDALKAAGKTVTYVKIPGDDHSLLLPGNRTTVLEAARDFIARNIGKAN
ncbi:MAG TPA: prolyl oligopeptidase family serine peptidase [Hyphomonadaceae bacterium]|nr:prolyl oligopeptidase family serine peptidase [Hyphomonadaceae bacterium]